MRGAAPAAAASPAPGPRPAQHPPRQPRPRPQRRRRRREGPHVCSRLGAGRGRHQGQARPPGPEPGPGALAPARPCPWPPTSRKVRVRVRLALGQHCCGALHYRGSCPSLLRARPTFVFGARKDFNPWSDWGTASPPEPDAGMGRVGSRPGPGEKGGPKTVKIMLIIIIIGGVGRTIIKVCPGPPGAWVWCCSPPGPLTTFHSSRVVAAAGPSLRLQQAGVLGLCCWGSLVIE